MFRLIFLLPVREFPQVTPFRILLAWMLALFIPALARLWHYLPDIELSTFGLAVQLGVMGLSVTAIILAVTILHRPRALPLLLMAIPYGILVSQIAYYLIYFAGWLSSETWAEYWLVWGFTLLPVFIICLRVFTNHALGNFGHGLTVFITYLLFLFLIDTNALFYSAFEITYDEPAAEEQAPERVDVEKLYYAQAVLMEQQLANLRNGDPERMEVFALLGAGYPQQGVFLREVRNVEKILNTQYSPAGTVILANSQTEPEAYPMLNQRNLDASLQAIAQKMNTGQDILFLFLTSHGSEDMISSSYWWERRNLTATALAQSLETAAIKNIVLVVSACKSGSFIDELQGEGRLIITAAADDANSFGCSNEAEWTWWGRAFFEQSLRKEPDFRVAFEQAVGIIETWEDEGNHTPSKPQISLGSQMSEHLDRFVAQENARCKIALGQGQEICLSDIWSPRK